MTFDIKKAKTVYSRRLVEDDSAAMLGKAIDRIEELEAALIEERARSIWFATDGGDTFYPEEFQDFANSHNHCKFVERSCKQLQSEGILP
jgi:hypothetical protein